MRVPPLGPPTSQGEGNPPRPPDESGGGKGWAVNVDWLEKG